MTPPPTARRPDVSTLLRQVHRLELAARRNAAGMLSGDYLTAVRGQGMVFSETRKYVEGDPVRLIDWNTTARLGEPYVKVHLEERQRQVILALDVSPSMHTGSQRKTKLEQAVEIAATLAVSAIDGGDRLGWVIFADRVLAEGRPRGGKRQLFRALEAMLEHTRPWTRPVAVSDPRAAVHAIEGRRRGRFVVFLISDFIDRDVPADLRYLKPRHDVSLLHVYDPLEYAAPGPVVCRAYAPEGEPGAGSLRPGEGESLEEVERFLRLECARLRITFDSFSTAQPVRSALDHFFHRKRRRLARAPAVGA